MLDRTNLFRRRIAILRERPPELETYDYPR
jgi:hypothetical protein